MTRISLSLPPLLMAPHVPMYLTLHPASPQLQDTGMEELRVFGHVRPVSSIQREGEREQLLTIEVSHLCSSHPA